MLNATEKDIFGSILENAIDEMSNNTCNDAPVRVEYVNKDELKQFINEYVQAFDEEDGAEWKEHLLNQMEKGEVYFSDYLILELLAKKLLTA